MNDNQDVFSLTVSCIGTRYTVDSNQLNMLNAAASDDSEARALLIQIENLLKETYEQVTPLMRRLLEEVFGEVEESRIKAVSESTMFYNKEGNVNDQ